MSAKRVGIEHRVLRHGIATVLALTGQYTVADALPEPLQAARDKALARVGLVAGRVDNHVEYQWAGSKGHADIQQALKCWQAKESRARRDAVQPVSEEVQGALDLAPPVPLNPADAPHQLLLEFETVRLRPSSGNAAGALEYEATGSLGKKKRVRFDALILIDPQRQELLELRYSFNGMPMTRKLDYRIQWSDTPQGWLPVAAEYSFDMSLVLFSVQMRRQFVLSGWQLLDEHALPGCKHA